MESSTDERSPKAHNSGRQLAYPETRCQEDLTHVISLINLGLVDPKDYPMIPEDLRGSAPVEKEMSRKEKIIYYIVSACLFAGLGVVIFYVTSPCSFILNMGRYECDSEMLNVHLYCPEEYTETEKESCDECGIANLNITQDPASWPFIAIVRFMYTWDQNVYDAQSQQKATKTFTKIFACTGTIVDRQTVVTIANCYRNSFEYEYESVRYAVRVMVNRYYPTISSIYTVFASIKPGLNLTQQVISADSLDDYFTKFYVQLISSDLDDYDKNYFVKFVLTKYISLNSQVGVACMHLLKTIFQFPHLGDVAHYVAWTTTSLDNDTRVLLKFKYFQTYITELAYSSNGLLRTQVRLDNSSDTTNLSNYQMIFDGDALFESDRMKENRLSLVGIYSSDNNESMKALNGETAQRNNSSSKIIIEYLFEAINKQISWFL